MQQHLDCTAACRGRCLASDTSLAVRPSGPFRQVDESPVTRPPTPLALTCASRSCAPRARLGTSPRALLMSKRGSSKFATPCAASVHAQCAHLHTEPWSKDFKSVESCHSCPSRRQLYLPSASQNCSRCCSFHPAVRTVPDFHRSHPYELDPSRGTADRTR